MRSGSIPHRLFASFGGPATKTTITVSPVYMERRDQGSLPRGEPIFFLSVTLKPKLFISDSQPKYRSLERRILLSRSRCSLLKHTPPGTCGKCGSQCCSARRPPLYQGLKMAR